MKKLIAWTIAPFNFLIEQFPAKQFLAALLVGFFLLNTNVSLGNDRSNSSDRYFDRPETNAQWKQEGRATENAPGERVKNIAGESAQAVKDMGEMYKDTAKRTVDAFKNDTGNSDNYSR
ncbi:MAG: hypothetical protein KME17_07580 [Cyanosarcina radialis HA8281-LM2]|nr:hypothetical protein [Cyanosarcina radialis HA8281-LM2]